MQGKNNGEEENRVKKTEDSSCSLLSHFWSTSRSPFLHHIYHFKAQEVKNLTLQTVYDLELKWGRYDLRKTTASSHGNTISQGDFLHGAKFGHFAPWRTTLRNFARWLFTLRNLDLSSSPFAKCLWNPLFWDAVDDIPLPVLQDILLDF